RCLDEDREILARLRLADEIGQHLRTQGSVAGILIAPLGRDDARGRAHAATSTGRSSDLASHQHSAVGRIANMLSMRNNATPCPAFWAFGKMTAVDCEGMTTWPR